MTDDPPTPPKIRKSIDIDLRKEDLTKAPDVRIVLTQMIGQFVLAGICLAIGAWIIHAGWTMPPQGNVSSDFKIQWGRLSMSITNTQVGEVAMGVGAFVMLLGASMVTHAGWQQSVGARSRQKERSLPSEETE